MFFSSCQSEDLVDANPLEEKNYQEYCVTFENVDFDKLKSTSDPIPVKVQSELISSNMPTLRSGDIIETYGTIQKLEAVQTIWRPDRGDKLVPVVFTGDSFAEATISIPYKISVTVTLPNPDMMVRGFTGEWSGYSYANLRNTQERYQGMAANGDDFTFTTYVWNIVSDISGRDYGYTGGNKCYVPFKDETKARIYYRIYQ